MKLFLTSTFLIFFSILIVAQSPSEMPRQKFFTTAVGLTWQTRKDDLFSPLAYTGYGAELHIGSERISEKWFKQFELWGNANQIQSRVNKGYNYSAYGFRYGVSQIWARRVMPQQAGFKWYVGGSVFHSSSMGYYPGNTNNIFSFNVPTGLAAATYLMKNVRFFKKNWILSTQLTIPVVAYDARPTYIGFADKENFTKEYGVVTFNKLLNIDWRWQIDLPLTNGNHLRAIYRWDYMDDKHNGRLQVGTQSLLIQSLFNIPFKIKNLK